MPYTVRSEPHLKQIAHGFMLPNPCRIEVSSRCLRLADDDTMACEDLCLADLNGDGKLDIVAAERATKNVMVYFNHR